ncbi:MAG: hypothetical protein AB7T22_00565 [Calditrichaceae bacterium]
MNKSILMFMVLTLAVMTGQLTAQTGASHNYHLLIEEISLFRQYYPMENDSQALIDSAAGYAQNNDFDMAVVFLEQIISKIKTENAVAAPNAENSLNIYPDHSDRFEWMIRSGIDFNRQEFEINYVENDSLLTEEIQKPFIGFQMLYWLIRKPGNTGLTVKNNFRYDEESLEENLEIRHIFSGLKVNGYMEYGFSYDKNSVYEDFGYMETSGIQHLSWNITPEDQLQIDNTIRYKKYKNASRSIPDFVKNTLSLNLFHLNEPGSSTNFYYNADMNESLKYSNNDFLEQNFKLSLSNLFTNSFKNELSLGFRHNRYAYSFDESVNRNQSRVFSAETGADFLLRKNLFLESDYILDYKNYSQKTDQEPDYIQHRFDTVLKKYFNDYFDFQLGYLFETRHHFLRGNAGKVYVDEQNYTGNGIITGIDYSGGNNTFISLSGSYTWRRYPYAQDAALSIYSDRNVFSLFLIGQIPVAGNIIFNIFASYDNDQDKDWDKNDTRSALFTSEIEYKF